MYLELNTIANDDRPVYISGDFCNWNPCDERFLMKKVDEGNYFLDLNKDFTFDKPLRYKYTKGGWEHVELDIFGNTSQNRTLSPIFEPHIDHVPLWGKTGSRLFSPNICQSLNLLRLKFPNSKKSEI